MFGFFGKAGDELLTCAEIAAEITRFKKIPRRNKEHQAVINKRIRELQALYNSKCLVAPTPGPGPTPGPTGCPALPTFAAPPGCYWETYTDANGCTALRPICPPPPAPPVNYPPTTLPPTGAPGGGFEPVDYGSGASIYPSGGGGGGGGAISPPVGGPGAGAGFEPVDDYEDNLPSTGPVPMVSQVSVPTPGMGPFVEGGDELNQVLPALYNDDYGSMKVLRIVSAQAGGSGASDGGMPGVGPIGPVVSEELESPSYGMEGLSYIGLSRSLG